MSIASPRSSPPSLRRVMVPVSAIPTEPGILLDAGGHRKPGGWVGEVQ
jgi:hypothetical protein